LSKKEILKDVKTTNPPELFQVSWHIADVNFIKLV